jgi:putative nucleotidyltransferase with HDIG domain
MHAENFFQKNAMTPTDIISKVKHLPPVSQAALKLVSLLEQDEISNEDIERVIKCDNVLTAKLLRACNSPYFGLAEPVSTVDQAVLILGHQQILHIVLTLAFGTTMNVTHPAYAAEAAALWQHSLATASAAEIVASETFDAKFEGTIAFTVGLLHDIGKLAISQGVSPEQREEIRALVENEKISRSAAEKKVLGTDHCEVGAALLKTWRLPAEIIEAVANHHSPPLETPALSAVTHVANALAHCANPAPSDDATAGQVLPAVAAALNFSADRFEGLIATVREASEATNQMMTV